MLIYEYKVAGSKQQYAAIDEAIRVVQFIRNKCLRLWMDGHRIGKNDLQRPYPGAQGNVRTPVRGTGNAGKRFWTVYLYSPLPVEDEQVGWMKEEPPSFMAGSVRRYILRQNHIASSTFTRVTYCVVTCKCERS
jgi:hypothetical protein